MRKQRTREEILVDKLLLLYLTREVNNKERIEGVTKFQKLAYLSARTMIDNFCKGFHYKFTRYLQGAFSRSVETEIDQFAEKGLLEIGSLDELSDVDEEWVYRTKGPITLTKYSEEVLDIFEELLNTNNAVIACIDEVCQRYGSWSTTQIKDYVYSLRAPIAGNQIIRNLNPIHRRVILTPPSDKRTKFFFQTDESWIETLEVCLNPGLYGSLKKGIQSAQREHMKPYIPLVD